MGYSVESRNLCYLPARDFIYLVDGVDGVHSFCCKTVLACNRGVKR